MTEGSKEANQPMRQFSSDRLSRTETEGQRFSFVHTDTGNNSIFGFPSAVPDQQGYLYAHPCTGESFPKGPIDQSFSMDLQRSNSASLMISDSNTRDKLIPPQPLPMMESPSDQQNELAQIFYSLPKPIKNSAGEGEKKLAQIIIVNQPKQSLETLPTPTKPLKRKQSVHIKKPAELSVPSPQEEEHSYRSEYFSRSQQQSLEAESENHRGHNQNARPDKNMKKIIFTPFKKILHDPNLLEGYGIDLSDYFEICPNTRYGHRTWIDFEIVFWFVERRYGDGYSRFVDYMNKHREVIDEYGRASYSKDKQWLKVYKKTTDCIYKAMNSGKDSETRINILYGKRRPSQHALRNIAKKLNQFVKAGYVKHLD